MFGLYDSRVFERMECAKENGYNPALCDPEIVADELVDQCDEFENSEPSSLFSSIKFWQEKELRYYNELKSIIENTSV